MGKGDKPKPSRPKDVEGMVATCKQNCKDGAPCGGQTTGIPPAESESDAMALCWHRDGCAGGHDDRNYDFS